MSTIPESGHILPPDHPVVRTATDALVTFAGEDLERDLAAVLLPAWQHAKSLTDREFRSILAAFALPEDTPPTSWLHLAGYYPDGQHPAEDTHGWISGSMGGDEIPAGVDGNSIGTRYAVCSHCGRNTAIVGGRLNGHQRDDGSWCRDSGRPVLT